MERTLKDKKGSAGMLQQTLSIVVQLRIWIVFVWIEQAV